MTEIITNLSDLRERVVELSTYLELSHPADVEALSDELGALCAVVQWKEDDYRAIHH